MRLPTGCERGHLLIPSSLDGVYDLPAQFDFVGAREERGVARHGIEQQAFVGLRERRFAELLAELELHFHRTEAHTRAGHLGFEAQVHGFARLDAKTEVVGARPADIGLREQVVGHVLELDGDFGDLAIQQFTRTQVERHALPAPVVNEQAQGGEGRRRRTGRDPRFVAIGAILAADGVHRHFLWRQAAHGLEHLHLLIAQEFGVEGGRRLHGGEGHQLKQVILHDIA